MLQQADFIGTLLAIEREGRWLPRSAVQCISERLDIPVAEVRRVLKAVREVLQEQEDIDSIIDRYGGDKSALIQLLLDIQKEKRWIPKSAIMRISEKLGVPLGQIYQIGTFYKALSLVPQGRHQVRVCMGTACHVRGSPRLLERVVQALNIEPGATSADQKFTLSTVNCVGCCALGPVLVADGEYHSNPSAEETKRLVDAYD